MKINRIHEYCLYILKDSIDESINMQLRFRLILTKLFCTACSTPSRLLPKCFTQISRSFDLSVITLSLIDTRDERKVEETCPDVSWDG